MSTFIKSVTATSNVSCTLVEALSFHNVQEFQLCLNGTITFINSHELHARKEELTLAFWYAGVRIK